MTVTTNYIDRIAEQIADACDGLWSQMPDDGRLLYRIYAVLVLSKGTETTRRDVHDAWSAFTAWERPGHRSLVPFDQLTPAVRELDQQFVDAIHAAARQLEAQ